MLRESCACAIFFALASRWCWYGSEGVCDTVQPNLKWCSRQKQIVLDDLGFSRITCTPAYARKLMFHACTRCGVQKRESPSWCAWYSAYSTTPRNGNRVNGNHLDQSLSFSQKNGNSLTWVLVALPVCPTSPLRLRDSAEPRPNLELASGNCES